VRLGGGFGDELDDLLGRVGHGVAADDRQSGLPARVALPAVDVVALEPNDERELQPDLAHRLDDAGGDHVAVHDAAEDVDEDRPSRWGRRG
jgi:hypothetical protein